MKIYFNSSFPRAGSTLLQNILAQNPRFYCTPTSGVFDLLLASRMNFSKLPEVQAQDREEMRKLFTGYCRGALEGAMGAMTDKPVAVDKSRGWMKEYDWLADFMPNPKIIVCIRDLRAILSSMEKGWRKYPHLQPGETLGDATGMKMVTIETRVAHWLNTAPLGAMVTHLLGQMERGNLRHFHIVRFEDLTTQPEQVLKGIYDYLEEPHFAHDFKNVAQLTHENDAFFPVYASHTIRQEVKPVSLDYYDLLGKTLSHTIKQDNSAFYTAFYPGK